jgi:hypothetical protein
MVLDLVVETSDEPGQDPVARAEVDRGLDLVHRPQPRFGREVRRRGEVGLLDAMCELEGHGHDQAHDHRVGEIRAEDDPPRVEEQRNHDRPGDEDRLPADETDEVPASWKAQRARPDAPPRERRNIAHGLPPEPHDAVERPDVVVLEPVPRARRLDGHEPCERHLGDVRVVAVHVGVRVMGDVVLHAPRVAREPEERIGRPTHQVVAASRPGSRRRDWRRA